MRHWWITLAAVLASFGQDQPQALQIHTEKLPNGLSVVLAEDRSRPVVNIQVWYHVGSRDERAGRTGFAHLFEHMMFRGSRNLGPEEHFRLVQKAGGDNNAYTSFDQTVYHQTVPPNYLEQMLWAEADRMASLVINEAIFEKERKVVMEERRLRIENPPFGLLTERILANLYKEYPYKHAPIGSMEDLNKATAADVQEFFDTYYVPNNATLVVVGDLDAKRASEWIRKYFGPIPRGRKPVPRVTAKEPPRTKLEEVKAAIPNVPIPVVVKGYMLPPLGHPDSYPLEIASTILSGGQSSRLYRKLVYEDQTAVEAQGQAMFLAGPSPFFMFGIVNQANADPGKLERGLQSVLDTMVKEPVTPEELEKAKTQVERSFVLSRVTMEGKASALGRAAVLLGDPGLYRTELAAYRKVTAADVQRVCAKYLIPSNETRMIFSGETK